MDQRLALVTAYQEKSITNVRLQDINDNTAKEVNKLLNDLVDKGLLVPKGTGRGRFYVLSDIFSEDSLGNNKSSLGNSEDSLGNNRNSLRDNENRLLTISKQAREKKRLNPEVLTQIILSLCSEQFLTVNELAQLLDRKPDSIRKGYVKKLVNQGKLRLRYPNTPSHQEQAYKTVE